VSKRDRSIRDGVAKHINSLRSQTINCGSFELHGINRLIALRSDGI
jgi:hypothetical protein